MRTVFSNRQCVHIWASQSQSYGQNASRSIYFQDRTIYSYGLHFPMARFVECDSRAGVLINSERWSPTTAKHKSIVRMAVSHIAPQFHIPARIWGDHAGIVAYYSAQRDETLAAAKRARTNAPSIVECAQRIVAECNEYIAFYALDVAPLEMPADIGEHMRAIAEKVKAANAQRDADARALLARWIAGESVTLTNDARAFPIVLRVRNDAIETSWGAEVPVCVAPMLWRMVETTRARAVSHVCDGPRIGNFELRRIGADGSVQIGCHDIAYSELRRIAVILKLTDEKETV